MKFELPKLIEHYLHRAIAEGQAVQARMDSGTAASGERVWIGSGEAYEAKLKQLCKDHGARYELVRSYEALDLEDVVLIAAALGLPNDKYEEFYRAADRDFRKAQAAAHKAGECKSIISDAYEQIHGESSKGISRNGRKQAQAGPLCEASSPVVSMPRGELHDQINFSGEMRRCKKELCRLLLGDADYYTRKPHHLSPAMARLRQVISPSTVSLFLNPNNQHTPKIGSDGIADLRNYLMTERGAKPEEVAAFEETINTMLKLCEAKSHQQSSMAEDHRGLFP